MKSTMLAVALVVTALMVSAVPSGASLITVSANPLWTTTGTTLGVTDTVTIWGATGLWDWGTGLVGPDGSPGAPWVYDEWITNGSHGMLIGYIGNVSDPNTFPRLIPQNDSSLFEIGTGTVVKTGVVGTLWLGFNDAYTSPLGANDNRGTVNVDVSSVPEPSTLLLLGSGLVGLVGFGRKRLKK